MNAFPTEGSLMGRPEGRSMGKRSVYSSLAWGGAGLAAGYMGFQKLRESQERLTNRNVARGKRILIVGAGFGGMSVARELARLLPDRANGEIVLIDSDNYLLFTPMLTEAAGGELDARHIISPVRQLSKRVQFVQGRVTKIDVAQRSLTVEAGSGGLDPTEKTYTGDHLVIALGSVTNFHHTPGAAENAIPMKRLEDAAAVCNRVLACLERAAVEDDPSKRKELLTFVVGGGGYTGVETMAAVNDLVRDSVRQYPKIEAADVRTIIMHPDDRLLPEITPELASYAQEQLECRGVEVMLNTRVKSAGKDFVESEHGERIPARTLIWTAGVTPNPLIEELNQPKSKHGALLVSECCELEQAPGVWSLGDCAAVPMPDGKESYGPTAQNAIREGKLVAQNIVATLRGDQPTAFRYTPIGELALVGKRSGVARIYGHNFSGPIAWALWRAIYLSKMPGLGQQARILGDWVLDLALGREPTPLVTPAVPSGG
jgi:NADH dehydrogenase